MQKVVQCDDCDFVFVGQHGMKFLQRGIGMIVYELSHFLFIGSEFEFGSTFVLLGSDIARFPPLLTKVIDPRGTDRIFRGDRFAPHPCIAILQYSFSQIQ